MADLPTPVNPLEKKEPQIHVIPDEFYGAAARARIPAPQVAVSAKGQVPSAKTSAETGGPVKKGSNAWVLIPIIAVLALGGMGFAVWYFVLSKPATKPPVVTPVVTPPPVVTPTPTPTPEPATSTPPVTPTEPATSTPPVVTPTVAVDTDNDGLTDIEETLYGTDAAKADTDGDGYSDSVEVINLYNPAGFKPTTLIAAGLVTTFDSKEGGYQMFYPTPWTPNAKSDGGVTFANAQNQPISVAIADNPDNKAVLDWYLGANPTVAPSQAQQFFTKSGAEAVRGPDPQISYVAGHGRIYIISYAPGTQDPPYFLTTFKMMVNSFKVNP